MRVQEDYNELYWFTVVARERSFTRAAALLGVSQSTISNAVKRLEERLGLRLLIRTTRSVSTTEVGEKFLSAIRPRLDDINADIADLMRYRDRPFGTVRINLSDYALESVVWPKLRDVLREYPDVNVELYCDNGISDIIEERFDAGIRLGERLDKDMIAVKIGENWRLVVVGSPQYFEQNPIPYTPQDLATHQHAAALRRWALRVGIREGRQGCPCAGQWPTDDKSSGKYDRCGPTGIWPGIPSGKLRF
nr:LysR family transcriptional regulator [Rhizobium sp. T136]